jgi:biopolymer transport protein ExbB/TolQ
VNKLTHLILALLRSPILWGGLASVGFFALIQIGFPGSEFFQRYCAGHPIEYTETVMFFIGLAALAIKALDLSVQFQGLSEPLLGTIPRAAQPLTECETLAARLARLPERRHGEYLVGRLRKGLDYLRRRKSPEGLEDELRYLADVDADEAHAGYGLVRMCIWAIPILGFLGTVVGITMAIARLAPQALESSLPAVVGGLGVAFDTTALALALSMILYFTQYFLDRKEMALLATVGERVEAELMGRFEVVSSGPDGQVFVIRKMGEALLGATEQLVQRQAEIWQASVEATQQRAARMLDASGQQLQKTITAALSESLMAHAQAVNSSQQAAEEKNRRHWGQLQEALSQYVAALAGVQNTLVEKAEVLARAVDATGQVAALEENLNRNLGALAGAKNFEQTVMSLAAAIHLLNARLGDVPTGAPTVHLGSGKRASQAA